jgi:hypothetical protein
MVSGTNCFGPVRTVRSSPFKAKVFGGDPDFGGFPTGWVYSKIMIGFFGEFISGLNTKEALRFQELTQSVSSNRRATEYFLINLHDAILGRPDYSVKKTNCDILETCYDTAYMNWGTQISTTYSNSEFIQLLNVLEFPEYYGGKATANTIEFVIGDGRSLNSSFQKYLLAGSVQSSFKADLNTLVVYKPIGVMRRLFDDLLKKNLLTDSHILEINAFYQVSKSVDIEKGHWLERIMAAELTTPSPIYGIINSRYQLGQEGLVQQPSLQGKDFLYFPALHEVPFSPKDGLTNICCVKEDPKRKGDRLVVLSCVFNKSTQKHLRIMMEIKKGYKQSDLYKLCLNFSVWKN